MWCAADNHNYICVTYVQKDFEIQTSMKQLLTEYQNFHESAPNFAYSQN